MSDYEKVFKSSSVWKSIATMAVPSLITILVMVFYNMADMFFIGQLGNTSMVASISLVSPVFSLIQGIATMIGSGGSVIIANALGAGEKKQVRSLSSVCFWSSVLFGLLLIAVVLGIRSPLLRFLGASSETWKYAWSYMSILSVGIPFMLVSTALGNVIRSEGAVKASLIGNLTGTITNIVLDPVFILGFGWNVPGAAAATVIGNIVACTVYIFYILKKSPMLSIRIREALPQAKSILPVLALGLPNAIATILTGFSSSFSNRLLSGYGTDAIAAMGAAGKTSMLIAMVMIGICVGCQPLLSFSYGARDQKRMKELTRDIAILTVILGAGLAVFCFTFRGAIVRLFLKEDSVVKLAEKFVIFMVIGSPFLGFYQLSTNFLQAAKNAPAAVFVSVLRQGILLIPLLYICHGLFGLIGIPLASTISDISSSLISLLFFFREYRKFQKLPEEVPAPEPVTEPHL